MPDTLFPRFRVLSGALLFALLGIGLGADATAQTEGAPLAGLETGKGSDGNAVTLNLKDADIQAFISAVSELTGRNFIIDPRVKGTVTVVSSAPTEPDALYEVFLSVLKVNGFVAVPSGNVIKILPDINGRQEGTAAHAAGRAQGLEQLTTAVIPTTYVNAAELVPVLRPLLPQEAHLAATARADALVMADTASNVNRIMRIVGELDRDNAEFIEVIGLKHAEAIPLVSTVQQLLAANPETPGLAPPIAGDERSNSVLIGGAPAEKLRMRTLIRELDVPRSRRNEQIEVLYLRYAKAEDLVPVLQSIGNRAEGGAAAPAGQAAGATGATGGTGSFEIQADKSTNSIVVLAEPELLAKVKAVVEKLDIRRAQVLVEGLVAEVSNNKANELGVQWTTSIPNPRGLYAGSSFPGIDAGAIPDPFSATSTPKLLSGLTFGYFSAGDIRTLVRALSGDQYTNVLSTPTLMTLDNAEAEIVVGQNVPFVTGQFTNNTTTPDNPFQTIERQDVGIVLKVKPRINNADTLTLEIQQEVSSVDRATSGANLITNKRSIKTSVLVDDKQIIVLGGLISDEMKENESRIPLIGEIPGLGMLFRNSSSDYTKTNLMVFLRPSIVRDQAANKVLTGSRYKDMQRKQAAQDEEHRFFLREDGPRMPDDGLAE